MRPGFDVDAFDHPIGRHRAVQDCPDPGPSITSRCLTQHLPMCTTCDGFEYALLPTTGLEAQRNPRDGGCARDAAAATRTLTFLG
jgi:hypothetical protein